MTTMLNSWTVRGRSKVALIALAGLVACGNPRSGGGGADDAGVMDGSMSTAAGLSLLASRAEFVTNIAGTEPAAGRRFLQVDVSVSNVGLETLSIAYPLFSVRTSSGLQVMAAVATGALAQRCAEDQSLAPGGMTACQLAFEIPTNEQPLVLTYSHPMGLGSSSTGLPIPSEDMFRALCERYVSSDNTQGCLSCRSSNTCVPPSCDATQCPGSCRAITSASDCRCLDACVTIPTCRQSYRDFFECFITQCESACGL